MATHDYIISNASGAAVRSDLNNALAAIVSNNSSATEPATTYAYMWWADTTSGQLKLRNAANDDWVVLLELDGTTLMEDGTVSAPGLAFADDTNTGFYRPAADSLGIATNGTNAIYIDSSQNVGIGRTPSYPLDVNTGTGVRVRFGDGTNNVEIYGADGRVSTGADLKLQSFNNDITFGTGGSATERMRIDSSGNVGIKNTAPLAQLHITNSSGTEGFYVSRATGTTIGDQPSLRVLADASKPRIYGYGDGLTFWTAATSGTAAEAFRITSQRHLKFSDASADPSGGSNIWQKSGLGLALMGGQMAFYTGTTERVRISENGRFSAYSDSDTVFAVRNAGTAAASPAFVVYNNSTSTTTGSIKCVIRQDGDLENSNNSYGAISDVKLKENIVDAASQWDDLKAIQVRKYNFKEETGHDTYTQIGVIAQEIETVSPGLVSESPDLDGEGNDLGTVTKSVNYSVLYMKAVKALQEAMERIETLEAKVAALESA